MRSFKTSIVISILLIVGAIGYFYGLEFTSNKLSKQMEVIQSSAELNDWMGTNEQLSDFKKDFKKKSKILSTLVNHYEIDSISLSLEKLIAYGEYEDKTNFMAEINDLMLLIEHLPDKEKFNLQNFL